jgi:putative DNA primase/helicase
MLTELHDIRDADKLADTIVDQIIAVLQCAPALPARSNYLDWALVLADARRTAAECIYARIRDHVDRHDWLWQGHILRGSQELLTGIPGGGKSQIHCAFVTYVTTGGAWPDHAHRRGLPRSDHRAAPDRGRRRSRARSHPEENPQGQQRTHVSFGGGPRLACGDDREAWRRAPNHHRPAHSMGHKLDSHRATDVRGQLGPLADLAERSDVALSCITHPPKHATQRAIDHFIGSQAFIAAARIGHMSIEEMDADEHGNHAPTGRSLFTNPKNNVSRKMSTLAYRIIEKQLDSGIKAPCITWEEAVDITADQAVAATMPSKERGRQSDCIVFLMNTLANGPVLSAMIEEQGATRGFSKDQLERAKKKMGVVAFHEKKVGGRWFWALPQHAPKEETP